MKKLFSLLILLSFTIKAQDVTIGTQTWTSKNLDVSKFRNGEAIPLAKTDAEWSLAGDNKQPAWCYYENKGENGTTYGKLYNWYAVNNARGLAPNGYHIPTDEEWTILSESLGRVSKAGTKMKSATSWQNNGNATITSRFEGLLGGCRSYLNNFIGIGAYGYWWSSSETIPSLYNLAQFRYLIDNNSSVNRDDSSKRDGFSVRCLRDSI